MERCLAAEDFAEALRDLTAKPKRTGSTPHVLAVRDEQADAMPSCDDRAISG